MIWVAISVILGDGMVLAVNINSIVVNSLLEEVVCGPGAKRAGVFGGKEVTCLVVSEEAAK
jgi:hypothetical protein